jgi:hypothetical protein
MRDSWTSGKLNCSETLPLFGTQRDAESSGAKDGFALVRLLELNKLIETFYDVRRLIDNIKDANNQ